MQVFANWSHFVQWLPLTIQPSSTGQLDWHFEVYPLMNWPGGQAVHRSGTHVQFRQFESHCWQRPSVVTKKPGTEQLRHSSVATIIHKPLNGVSSSEQLLLPSQDLQFEAHLSSLETAAFQKYPSMASLQKPSVERRMPGTHSEQFSFVPTADWHLVFWSYASS